MRKSEFELSMNTIITKMIHSDMYTWSCIEIECKIGWKARRLYEKLFKPINSGKDNRWLNKALGVPLWPYYSKKNNLVLRQYRICLLENFKHCCLVNKLYKEL